MAHTTSTTGTVLPVGPSGPGALGGFEFRCGACAEVARFAFESMTLSHAADHFRYMASREAKGTRSRVR